VEATALVTWTVPSLEETGSSPMARKAFVYGLDNAGVRCPKEQTGPPIGPSDLCTYNYSYATARWTAPVRWAIRSAELATEFYDTAGSNGRLLPALF